MPYNNRVTDLTTIPPYSLFLIAVINSERDLEIARFLGWYRIPLRRAPKVIQVDYIAFYQTAAFDANQRWSIQYYCPVRGHELTTRGELLKDEVDHPRRLEEYYKIQLGEAARLRVPIRADQWKRVTFLYTTGEYFKQARTVHDLVVRQDDRELLWKSLRERSDTDNSGYTTENGSSEFDESLLPFLQLFQGIQKPSEVE